MSAQSQFETKDFFWRGLQESVPGGRIRFLQMLYCRTAGGTLSASVRCSGLASRSWRRAARAPSPAAPPAGQRAGEGVGRGAGAAQVSTPRQAPSAPQLWLRRYIR
jgi:hypothetical protein